MWWVKNINLKEDKGKVNKDLDQIENRSWMEDINLNISVITLYPKNIFKPLRKKKQPSRKMDKIFD